MSRPCRFFNTPGGCNRGSRCGFEHSTPNPTDANRQTPNAAPAPQNTSGVAKPPPGVCRYYWEQGKCKREFNCTYKHTQRTDPTSASRASTSTPRSAAALRQVAPFLTAEGLSKIGSGGTDGFFSQDPLASLSPAEAHNTLKRFLSDTYRFESALHVYIFLKPLNSATASNAHWTQEDGQLLLQAIASPNGLRRIIDVIRWPQVSVHAGKSNQVLSFQRGILPILRYLSSDFVVKSTMVTRVNTLFTEVLQNFDEFANTIDSSMAAVMANRSFKDPGGTTNDPQFGPQVLASIAGVLDECLVRFKNAVAIYPRLIPLVKNLRLWFDQWDAGISSSPPAFDNPFQNIGGPVRDLLVNTLNEKILRVESIVQRELGKETRTSSRNNPFSAANKTLKEGYISALRSMYDAPGDLRPDGPRHDNDCVDIGDIRVAPTHQELMCRAPPFLPASLFEAPHPAPAESMQRLLDVQFRLLREELTAPLRRAVQFIQEDLEHLDKRKTKLGEILQKGGGKYHGVAESHESVMFNVYTDVNFKGLVPDRRGMSTNLAVETPPGRARSSQSGARVAFWKGMSGKRLMQGGLVALVWKTIAGISVHLGTIANTSEELTSYVRGDENHVKIRVVFFDSEIELRILSELKTGRSSFEGTKVLVESPVLYEAIRPFLEALKTEPELLPFSRYLVFHPSDHFKACTIDPPKYTCLPGFSFQLSCLFDDKADVGDLRMNVSDKDSVDRARTELRRSSRLDPSQADAIIEALTRELVLIQGPPGTGKSYTGVELLRVLIANKIGPILMIAFTNHALDHMLCSVLNAGITTDIVRLGSRTSDERIAEYSIETREMVAGGQSRLSHGYSSTYHELKSITTQITSLIKRIHDVDLESDSSEVTKYLGLFHPEHEAMMSDPPPWVGVARDLQDDGSGGEWKFKGRKGQDVVEDTSVYAFWKKAGDVTFLGTMTSPARTQAARTPRAKADAAGSSARSNPFAFLTTEDPDSDSDASEEVLEVLDEEEDDDVVEILPEKAWMTVEVFHTPDSSLNSEDDKALAGAPILAEPPSPPSEPEASQSGYVNDPTGFFTALGEDGIPSVPSSTRTLNELIDDPDVWRMSRSERQILHTFWVEEARKEMQRNQQDEFDRLRQKHEEKTKEYNEIKDEIRRELLTNVEIIGCTTTGAAKLGSLLRSLSPKILLVEEAGQVLEAHVLGSLVPSVEHIILIGDPLQLRPTLNNYSLSMDHPRGGKLYRFDMSLMERLATSGLPMSRLDVQRRMRPTISSLIRNTLYEGLQDHTLVENYPDVRGMVKNVFFATHNHRENGGTDDTASKYNKYEVDMIRDLVLYLLRQGCYSAEGDIVVLCAYLGQLARLRDALADQVAIVIDERDQAALDDREGDQEDGANVVDGGSVQHVKVTNRVRLRTVDNYQGEEGRVVILSLVRNSGGAEEDETEEVHTISQHTRVNIGFLKSENRTNVALSRAREGLYIFGNVDNLSSKSRMWRSIIEELEAQDSVGPALPVACHRHRDRVEFVSRPGQLSRIAPDGGCMEQCDQLLKCGHLCPFKCHCDDPNHIAVACTKPCTRLCHRDHPCRKECHVPCGSCMYPVPNVRLPCGHVKVSVACYQLDMLHSIECDEIVVKQLPDCEHEAEMPCSQDPEDYSCRARCAEWMACCGKSCSGTCHGCRALSAAGDGPRTVTKRTKHVVHACQKRLYCEHPCQEPCSEEHEHTTQCKEKCRQVCPHAQCKKACSVPCAPCKQQCTWTCPHYVCPVPCGSVCTRLPCDRRCEKMLQCGHRCPSVCGEDCAVQVCPLCAPEEQRTQIADMIMQRTVQEIDPDQESLDEMLITIPSCRHTFTVETLDGHCGMSEFYSCGQDGRWLGLFTATGYRQPPTCPTCRSAITAPRYGRVFKRADLDILERNVAAQMAVSVGAVQTSVESVSMSAKREQLATAASKIDLKFKDKVDDKAEKHRNRVLNAPKETRMPVSEREITPDNAKLHSVDDSVSKVWRKAMHELLAAYRQAVKVAETRSAHTQAWEAAFSYLHQGELDALLNNPGAAPREPTVHAMRVAKFKIGQPRPLADRRFLVEALWMTLEIRLKLTDLTTTWMDAIDKRISGGVTSQQLSWATYIEFLFKSCLRDADVAFAVANDSESHRQISTTALYQMRISLEGFRFDMRMCKMTGQFANQEHRDALAARAADLQQEAEEVMRRTIQRHRAKKGSKEEMAWLDKNFSGVARVIVNDWEKIERSIRMDTFYQPVSLEEHMEIVGALVKGSHFSHAGHFYNCPNGHTFVITECGGATETANCPECGARIGGQSHHLDSTNTRNLEFEALARQAGIGPTVWTAPH